MEKRKIFFRIMVVFCITSPIVLNSCSTYGLTGHGAPMSNTSIKPDQIKANFNFNLNDRLTGKASATYLFWFIKVSGASTYSDIKGINITNGSNNIVNIFNRFGKMEKVKSAAVYDAVQGYDIDVIVNPQFETKTTTFLWFVKTYSARVKAYEGQIIELYQEKDDVILYDLILKKN